MTTLATASLFLMLALLDEWILGRGRGRLRARRIDSDRSVGPHRVGGFEFPLDRSFHQGHTWARPVGSRGDVALVGIDSVAGEILAELEELELPVPGTCLLQGETGFRARVHGVWAELLSPVDGQVLELNRDLLATPASCLDDPFGRGWLCKVRCSNRESNTRNLLDHSLLCRWAEISVNSLRSELESSCGPVLADGGFPAPGFSRFLRPEDWRSLTERLLLTPVIEEEG